MDLFFLIYTTKSYHSLWFARDWTSWKIWNVLLVSPVTICWVTRIRSWLIPRHNFTHIKFPFHYLHLILMNQSTNGNLKSNTYIAIKEKFYQLSLISDMTFILFRIFNIVWITSKQYFLLLKVSVINFITKYEFVSSKMICLFFFIFSSLFFEL